MSVKQHEGIFFFFFYPTLQQILTPALPSPPPGYLAEAQWKLAQQRVEEEVRDADQRRHPVLSLKRQRESACRHGALKALRPLAEGDVKGCRVLWQDYMLNVPGKEMDLLRVTVKVPGKRPPRAVPACGLPAGLNGRVKDVPGTENVSPGERPKKWLFC